MKLDYTLTPHTKINSKGIKDLTVRSNTIKIPEGNIGRIFFDINHRNIFLGDLSPQVKEIKTKINKWDLIKLKCFCTAKETIHKMKTYGMGGNICKLCNSQGLNFQNIQTVYSA